MKQKSKPELVIVLVLRAFDIRFECNRLAAPAYRSHPATFFDERIICGGTSILQCLAFSYGILLRAEFFGTLQ